MKENLMTVNQYEEMMSRMDKIQSILEEKQKRPEDIFFDNQEFVELMKISKRTAQSYRDQGIIAFSQLGSKIYYRMSDIQKLLDTNYRKAFNNKRKNF